MVLGMAMDLAQPEHGCLLLADITGYTDYIGGTELTHAQDVVADLLETIVDAVEPTFVLSKLEGDAAFAYASIDTINPTMVLDTIELAYFAFQKRLRDVAHSTTCPCEACVRIPTLDLKFFVHDGEYVVRQIARTEELTGSDVILIHRLAKGTSGDRIGKSAYAVYTKATLETMAMDPSILGFVSHTERFDDIGEVDVYIQDLAVRWTFEQERNRDFVASAHAVYEASFDTPAAPSVVWDHLTDPVKRPAWQQHVDEVVPMTTGRSGIGSVNHCMHGPDAIIEHVADWRPFSYLTLRYDVAHLTNWAWTYELVPEGTGTRVTTRLSDPGADAWDPVADDFRATVDAQAHELAKVLASASA